MCCVLFMMLHLYCNHNYSNGGYKKRSTLLQKNGVNCYSLFALHELLPLYGSKRFDGDGSDGVVLCGQEHDSKIVAYVNMMNHRLGLTISAL